MRIPWQIGRRTLAVSVAFLFYGAGSCYVASADPVSGNLVLKAGLQTVAVAGGDAVPGSSAENVQPPAQKEAAKSEGTSVNLLLNGDFEIPVLPGGSAGVDFWVVNPTYPVKAAVVKTKDAHSGQQVLRIEPSKPGIDGALFQYSQLIKGSSKYVYECYARGAGAQLCLCVYEYAEEGRYVGCERSKVFSLGPAWTPCRMEYQPAENIRYVAAALHVVAGVAEVDDARFLAVGAKAETYGKVEERPWRGNQLGISHVVPPPFIPVKVATGAADERTLTTAGPLADSFVLTCWGRTYRFAEGPLPSEIVSNGASLLAKPVTFHVSAAGDAPAAIQWRDREMKECGPDSVKLACDGVANLGNQKQPLDLSVVTTFEFDGMLRYDVTVQPKAAVSLEQFSLEIPLRPEIARFLHWQGVEDTANVPSGGRNHWGEAPNQAWHSTFSPSIWIGDLNAGLCWFAEAPRGWGNGGAEDRAVEIVPSKDWLMLRINFVKAPTTLDAQRTWTFGLLATPPKPVPNYPASQNVTTVFGLPKEYYPQSPSVGVTIADIPQETDPLEYHLTDQEKSRAMVAVRQGHSKKQLVVPWGQGALVEMKPGYVEYLAQWMARPAGAFEGAYVCYCQQSEGWRDLLVYAIVRLAKEYGFDGIYFDSGGGGPCMNPLHGCGYLDARGRWQATYSTFAHREFKKRLYRALYEATGRPPYILTLCNGMYSPATMTFETGVVSGEEWIAAGSSNDYRTVVKSLPQWEAQYNPTQWGLWPVLLPSSASKGDLPVTNSILAFALLEHTPLWVAYCDEKRVYAALDAIQKLGPEARFIPRWDSAKYVRVSSKECPAALYVAGNHAVIVVSNFGDGAVQTSVDCDLQALGWNAAALGASDAITGAALNVSRNQIAATVPANSFVMIHVSPTR